MQRFARDKVIANQGEIDGVFAGNDIDRLELAFPRDALFGGRLGAFEVLVFDRREAFPSLLIVIVDHMAKDALGVGLDRVDAAIAHPFDENHHDLLDKIFNVRVGNFASSFFTKAIHHPTKIGLEVW